MELRNRRGFIAIGLIVLCVAFGAAAMSRHLYAVTTPGDLVVRTVLRKLYSVGAFSIVGAVLSMLLRRPLLVRAVVGVAVFSALIEVGQHLYGVRESIAENLLDVGCGALGGLIGYSILRWYRDLRPKS